ncbi:hypothetical protein [Methylobacterium nodulans]|uniref:Uncharacterized protein n=1 Tax=Methylobacterium nodulans (strain LMG 21967 / CNCM I-2342 / ORS 2060) TaxID=460265 RepID=B8IAP1_METNO|nr:hypothetical protein [Methylobacterium nodulans]ACL61086.1 hypothetical protein Mnod_6281 [Methylobacterium nodulans ORS 2060]
MLTADQLAAAPVLILAAVMAVSDSLRLWAQERPRAASRPRRTPVRRVLSAFLRSGAGGFVELSPLGDARGKRAAGQRCGGGR